MSRTGIFWTVLRPRKSQFHLSLKFCDDRTLSHIREHGAHISTVAHQCCGTTWPDASGWTHVPGSTLMEGQLFSFLTVIVLFFFRRRYPVRAKVISELFPRRNNWTLTCFLTLTGRDVRTPGFRPKFTRASTCGRRKLRGHVSSMLLPALRRPASSFRKQKKTDALSATGSSEGRGHRTETRFSRVTLATAVMKAEVLRAMLGLMHISFFERKQNN